MPNDTNTTSPVTSARENDRQNPQPRERILRSTRGSAAERAADSTRDYDFDVDEELARLRLALRDPSPEASAFIREAFGNIDESLTREGRCPRAWFGSPRIEYGRESLIGEDDSERLIDAATDLADVDWKDETLRLRAIVFLARTGQRMAENRVAVEANRETAERNADREELLFNAQRADDALMREDRKREAELEMDRKRIAAEERRQTERIAAEERRYVADREAQIAAERFVAQEVAASRGKRSAKGRRKAK